VLLVGGAILLIASGIGFAQVTETVTRGQSAEQLTSLTGRDDIYRAAWQLFAEQPLIGYGYQSGRSIFLQRIPWAPGASHSALVDIAMSMGAVGLLAYLLLFVRLGKSFRTLLRRRTMTAENLWARELAPVVAMLLLMGVTVDGFSGPVGAQPIFLAFAVLAADAWWRSARAARFGGDGPPASPGLS
jgi:O-antigen ligase